MSPALFGALSLALFVAAMIGPQVDDLRWREIHHAYFGLMLLVVGLSLNSTLLQWVGAAMLSDDAVQHSFQRWGGTHSRVSVLHALYGLAYRIPLVRRVNDAVDEWFV